MKKNFFKKLSFVLALAMIVSVLAPAAGVFAKAAPKLNAKTVYLHLDVANKNEFDFNIANKQTGWKYLWSSANENVAEVNAKNGLVTATGVGSTKISVVISDKSGEEVDELTGTVVVRDNIKDLTITNKPAGDKLAVGVENDFNRSYTTVAGSTKKTSGITRWSVDKEGATINADNGKFVATAAGKYTITARSFQSKAKYTSWLSDNAKYASYVTATATYEVTVATSMVKAEQVDLDTFKVTFDSAVTDAATKLNVYYLAGSTKIKELVKEVKMDADNKVATVDMHLNLTKGATYVVEYPDMASVQFVAAKTDLADVTGIAVTTTTVELSKKKTVEVALYNKDNVNIATPDLLARVELKSSNNLAVLDGKDLYMYKVGDTTTITATFHTYKYESGKEVGNLTATGVITCVEQSKDNVGTLNAYTVATSAGGFKDVKHNIAKGDAGLKLFVQLKGKDASNNDKYTDNVVGSSNFGSGSWKYTSSDNSVVIVGADGSIWAAKEGTAVVVVKYNDVQVAACEIIVSEARKAAIVTLGTNGLVLSNNPNFADTKTVSVKVQDQLLSDYDQSKYHVEVVSNIVSADAENLKDLITDTSIKFDPTGVPAGTYYYTVNIIDEAHNNAKVPTYITVEVKKLDSTATVAYYKIESDNTSYDMKLTGSDTTEVVTLSLYGYTSDGTRLTKENINALPTPITVKDGNGNAIAAADIVPSGLDATINLVPTTASGASMNIVNSKAVGTWLVTATSGSPINAISFEVKNSQPVVKLNPIKTSTTKTDKLEAINDCFDFTLDGDAKDITSLANVEIVYSTDKSMHIENVYIYEQLGTTNTYIKHKIAINTVINYAQ